MIESGASELRRRLGEERESPDWREWLVCDRCNGVGSFEDWFYCQDCKGEGGTFAYPDPRLIALIEVAESALEALSPCDLAPSEGGRRWCMAHSEWHYTNGGSTCSMVDLGQALDRLVDVLSDSTMLANQTTADEL